MLLRCVSYACHLLTHDGHTTSGKMYCLSMCFTQRVIGSGLRS